MVFGERSKEKSVKGMLMPSGEEKLEWARKYRLSQSSMKEALIERKEKANFI